MHLPLPSLLLLPLLSLLALHPSPGASAPSAIPSSADSLDKRTHLSKLSLVVPNSYIVVLKKDVSRAVFRRHLSQARAERKFSIGSFHGYSATITDEGEVEALRLSPEVDRVEYNGYVQAAVENPGLISNTSTPYWNLHRISHRPQAPLFGPYSYLMRPFSGNCTTDAYILDSGLYIGHSEFGGRASHGFNAVGGSNEDATGHGTHVAGILIGKTYGVARQGRAVSIKVLDAEGSGTYAGVMQGIAWAVEEARRRGRIGRSVINMSIVGNKSPALNDACEAAYAAGIPLVAAAGNFGSLAVNFSPASAHNVFTIAAHDIYDAKPDWSNRGIQIDHFAPGVDIRSAFVGGPNSTAVISGTSMAAPHVAGIVNMLQCVEGLVIPRMIRERLEVLATKKEVVDGGNTSPHRIIYNGAQA